MKFVSKSSNLYIVLRPGLQAQPLTGMPATPTIGVRFQNGIVEVKEEEMVKMMLNHPAYNNDFISAEPDEKDPYAFMRQDSEPQHVMTEMKYGMPSSRKAAPMKNQFPPEIQKALTEMATQMAGAMMKEALPTAVAEAIASIQQSAAKDTVQVSAEPTSPVDTVAPKKTKKTAEEE